jgi:AraC family transcriptional activator of mar-sox-rob regulon
MRLKSPEELEFKGDALNFLFGKSGAGKFASPRATHRLAAGDILVFNGVTGGKSGVGDGKSEFQFWTFSISFENLLPLFASHEISLLHYLAENLKATRFFAARTPLAADCQRLLAEVPADFDLDHRGQLLRIAASVLASEFKAIQAQRGDSAGPDDHVAQVFERLSASDLINLSVGELAGRFSCSRRHLNRLFHQHFGVSVASLRMEMRLLKAVSLLRDANAKIINVAEECGFNHLGLFNTCFKRRFGVSPGQWRKSALKAEDASLQNMDDAKTAAPLPAMLGAVASKISGGTEILANLQRRNLLSAGPARAIE